MLFFLLFSSISLSQSKILSSDDNTLKEVLSAYEQKSGYVFNYDPELLNGYYFSGNLKNFDVNQAISKLLYETPFTFEINQKTILIYHPAQKEYRICGTLTDDDSQDPLIAANIAAVNSRVGTVSDVKGFFDFQITADKNQIIEISYLGYQTMSFMVQDLKNDQCPEYSISVDTELIGDEIIITDYILDGISQGEDYGSFVLDFDQLSKKQSNVEHDILKTVQLLPGISSIDESATNLQIRGSSPDQNLILWEGAPVYNAGHIFGMISAVNPFSVNEVNVFKGAYDPKYDNRVGGIIDISQSDSIQGRFNGSMGSTMTELHSSLDIPIIREHISLILSGRQSIKGIYDSPPLQSYTNKLFQKSLLEDIGQDTEVISEQLLDYNDWSAKLLFKPTQKISGNLGVYKNRQDFEFSVIIDEDPYKAIDKIELRADVINGQVNIKHNQKFNSSISFYNSTYRNEYIKEGLENGILTREYDQFNSILDRSFTYSNTYKPTSTWSLSAGYEHNVKQVEFDLTQNQYLDQELSQLAQEKAGFQNIFLSNTFNKKNLRVNAGIRSTFYQENSEWAHSPRVVLQYSLNNNLKIKCDAGIYHQFISQLSNTGEGHITVDNPLWILNTNESQLSQKANKLGLGFVYRRNGWLLDVDAYYNKTTGLGSISPVLSLLSGDHGFTRGSSEVKGIDFLLKKRWSGFNAWLNYSLAYAKNNFEEISQTPFFTTNDIRHNLSMVTSYSIKDIQLSLLSSLHSGLPYSRPDVIMSSDPDAEHPFIYFLDYPDLNAYRLKPYMRFDLNANYRLRLKRLNNISVEISLSIINLLDSENIFARDHFLDSNDMSPMPDPSISDKVLLGRTPLAMLRFYW